MRFTRRFRIATIPDGLTTPEYLMHLSARIEHELDVIKSGGKPSTSFTVDELEGLKKTVPVVLDIIVKAEKRTITLVNSKEFHQSVYTFHTHSRFAGNEFIKLAISGDYREWILYLSRKFNEFGV